MSSIVLKIYKLLGCVMKRLFKILPLLLLFCCIAIFFVACNKPDEHDKITADYAKLYNIDESNVNFNCYGEFNGTHILTYESRAYSQAFSNEIVDGVTFVHSRILTFDVYNNGNFYSLQEAFDNGLLSHDNLVTLRDNYNPQ